MPVVSRDGPIVGTYVKLEKTVNPAAAGDLRYLDIPVGVAPAPSKLVSSTGQWAAGQCISLA